MADAIEVKNWHTVRFRVSGEPFDIPIDELSRWKTSALYTLAQEAIKHEKTEGRGEQEIPLVALPEDVCAFRQIRHFMKTGEIPISTRDEPNRQMLWHAATMYGLDDLAKILVCGATKDSSAAEAKTVGQLSAKTLMGLSGVISDAQRNDEWRNGPDRGNEEVKKPGQVSSKILEELGIALEQKKEEETAFWRPGDMSILLQEDAEIREEENRIRVLFGAPRIGNNATKTIKTYVLLTDTKTEAKCYNLKRSNDATMYPRLVFPGSNPHTNGLIRHVQTMQEFRNQLIALARCSIDELLFKEGKRLPVIVAGGAVLSAFHRFPRWIPHKHYDAVMGCCNHAAIKLKGLKEEIEITRLSNLISVNFNDTEIFRNQTANTFGQSTGISPQIVQAKWDQLRGKEKDQIIRHLAEVICDRKNVRINLRRVANGKAAVEYTHAEREQEIRKQARVIAKTEKMAQRFVLNKKAETIDKVGIEEKKNDEQPEKLIDLTVLEALEVLARIRNDRTAKTTRRVLSDDAYDKIKMCMFVSQLTPDEYGANYTHENFQWGSLYRGTLAIENATGNVIVTGRAPSKTPPTSVKRSSPEAGYYRMCKSFRDADIDLFLTTRDPDEALRIILHVHTTLAKTFECIEIIRTRNSVTFECGRVKIQIVLRLYDSPEHVLIGFDVDCCAVAYDGEKVIALPRATRALETRTNIVNTTRQSLTYERRLFKYAKREFAIAVPGLDFPAQLAETKRKIDHWKMTKQMPSLVGSHLLIGMLRSIAHDMLSQRLFRFDMQGDYDVCEMRIETAEGHRLAYSKRITSAPPIYIKSQDINIVLFTNTVRYNGETPRDADIPKIIEFETTNPHAQGRADMLFTGSFNPTASEWFIGEEEK